MTVRLKIFFLVFICVTFFVACNKPKSAVIVTTAGATDIFPTSAKCGGSVFYDGDDKVSERGVCFNTTGNPFVFDNKIASESQDNNFSVDLSSLYPATKYYVRAYAKNKDGVVYGEQIKFTTAISNPFPAVTTLGPYQVNSNSGICTVDISNTNSFGLLVVGLCWGTNPAPTKENTKIIGNVSILSFTNTLTGLNSNSTYYVRGYAVNNSGTVYGNEIILRTYAGSVTDSEGNMYHTIIIGSQEWMTENLRVTKYRDGSPIEYITDNNLWGATPSGAYCYSNDLPADEIIYGKLYNYNAVTDPRKIAPVGWHIPTDVEWSTLVTALGGDAIAGAKMRATGGNWNSGTGTNESLFTALPGGARGNNGLYDGQTYVASFWSTTANTSLESWSRSIIYSSTSVSRISASNFQGLSVRCVKD